MDDAAPRTNGPEPTEEEWAAIAERARLQAAADMASLYDDPDGDLPLPPPAKKTRKPKKTVTIETAPQIPSTDIGNALRFRAEYGHQVRFCPPKNAWLTWTGTHWEWDDMLRIRKLIVDMVYDLARFAALERDTELLKHAIKSHTAQRLSACETIARSLPGITLAPGALDAHPFLLATPSGTLDLTTGTLSPADPAHLLTQLCPTPIDLDLSPAPPVWCRFLEEIFPDPDIRWFLQKAIGYSMTGDMREQCVFILHGSGANGKSTFLDTILAVLGPIARHVPSDLFRDQKGTTHPSNRAFLKGLRLAIVSETEHGQSLTESLIKQLTGDSEIDAREMYGAWFTFRPSVKLWWACNHLPHVKGTDNGFWRRVYLVPCTTTIPEDQQDKTLPARLLQEAPQIALWALQGCLGWLSEGLAPPPAVRHATAEYRTSEDFVAQFLDECCAFDPSARTRVADLFARQAAWAASEGWRQSPVKKKAFTQRLVERGFPTERSHGSTYVRGISLLVEDLTPVFTPDFDD